MLVLVECNRFTNLSLGCVRFLTVTQQNTSQQTVDSHQSFSSMLVGWNNPNSTETCVYSMCSELSFWLRVISAALEVNESEGIGLHRVQKLVLNTAQTTILPGGVQDNRVTFFGYRISYGIFVFTNMGD